jgi:RNA polymerase sigma-70 factor (ECF subfamily)
MTSQECREVFARLSEYLDGELPADLCEQIERHIGGCAPCVEFVESLKKSIELTKGVRWSDEPAPLPAATRTRVREAYQAWLRSRQ